MKTDFSAAMRQALQLVRSQDVTEATRVIQRAILDRMGDASPPEPGREGRPVPRVPVFGFDGTAEAAPRREPERTARADESPTSRRPSGRKRRPLGEVVDLLRQANLPGIGRGAAQRIDAHQDAVAGPDTHG